MSHIKILACVILIMMFLFGLAHLSASTCRGDRKAHNDFLVDHGLGTSDDHFLPARCLVARLDKLVRNRITSLRRKKGGKYGNGALFVLSTLQQAAAALNYLNALLRINITELASVNHSILIRSIPVVDFNPQKFEDCVECVICLSELADGTKPNFYRAVNIGFTPIASTRGLSRKLLVLYAKPEYACSKLTNQVPAI
ncbi:hypothetical protein F2Q69_00010005 [Brassica cretica]|uniref:Pectinesterase inhibitor domain-containing protein n=1 Tax=Brassica cretica TaxID=69181 RepID=A0A8S9PAF8_BRACR|nr:hypothetical protein F2Q69_00010005 [Brassica cretica]